jgi:hypothetical protein
MDDGRAKLSPVESLTSTDYVVDATVCSRGSYNWREVMGPYESKIPGKEERGEKSRLMEGNSTRKSVLDGILWEKPSQWGQFWEPFRKHNLKSLD